MDVEITDSIKFEKVYREQFYLMFDDIAKEFQYRLKTLKFELIKKLDIRERDIKKLQVITEENESDNESIKKSQEYIDSNSKDTNALWRGKTQQKTKMIRFLPNGLVSTNETINFKNTTTLFSFRNMFRCFKHHHQPL